MADPAGIRALQDAIRHLHGSESRHVETVHVHEKHEGKTVWEGDVEVFLLIGHPTAEAAYAWSEVRNKKRRFFAVLRVPPIDSPGQAIQASIFADARDLEKGEKQAPLGRSART